MTPSPQSPQPASVRVLTAGAHRASFGGGRFGWWIGVLRRDRSDLWECGHQHSERGEARDCAEVVLDVTNGKYVEAIRWRTDR